MNQITQIHSSKPTTGFDLQITDIGQAMKLATMIANSQLVPQAFKNRPEDTLVAMMMGNEVGLNPMQAIQNIAVINGRPTIWGDAMLALVQNNPKFGAIEETFDESTMTATCKITRKGGKPHVATFSKEDAGTAGLWGKDTWVKYPKRMLQMRARGFALRNQFADALLGLITAEEAQDLPIEMNQSIDHYQENPVVLQTNEEYYSQEKFEKIFPAWAEKIKSGERTPKQIIDFMKSKTPLTQQQIDLLTSIEVEAEK